MTLWKRGRQYWADFTVSGTRYRKRLGTARGCRMRSMPTCPRSAFTARRARSNLKPSA